MRLDNWPTLLAKEIEAARVRPFSFGEADCALWAADVVLAITGSDPAARWRGAYDSEFGALRLIAQHGGLRQMATEALGEPINPAFAQRGDMVLIADGGGYSLGICVGAQLAGMGERGLVFRPMSEAVCAWRT